MSDTGKLRASLIALLCLGALVSCRGELSDPAGPSALAVLPGSDAPGDSVGPECPDPGGCQSVPGPIPMQPLHRLSTFQHNRLIKDLVGIDYDVSAQLPKDSAVGGFNNAAEALSLAGDSLSLYFGVTNEIVEQGFPAPNSLSPQLNPSGCDASDGACARSILERLAGRAFRRAPDNPAIAPYLALFDRFSVDGVFNALKDSAKAVLMSPRFLLDGTLISDVQEELLNPYVTANRLSFFLWATGPDQELLDLADSRALLDAQVLTQQVDRMLTSTKAEGFLGGFVGHWLSLDRLRTAPETLEEFPQYNASVKAALTQETELFFREFMLTDISVSQLVDPSFGYLNDVLAEHYGLPLPGSSQMVKVPRGPGQRRGVFHLGGWHLAESDGAETNPIRRGAWVLDHLLCSPMPPPPPGVPGLPPTIEGEDLTIRERLALHRTEPSCAGCHQFLDPAGLGFEYFNAVGVEDPSQQSDGKFPGGIEFNNPLEIPDLMSGSRQVSDCVTQKLYKYAHARQTTAEDTLFIDAILQNLSGQESLAQVVSSVVLSPSFRNSPSLEVLNAGPPAAN